MGNLVLMSDELGYKNHKAMHWENEELEFHIYVEHTISKPILAEDLRGYVGVSAGVNVETVNLDDSSNNAYDEGGEDDMFNIPNPRIDSNNEDDIGASRIMTT
ncbi:hypothetical protein PIB30_000740 [Stylosanthes scabra]|uniref:Uncharacterized protein n=1 Tax=Stylosanthes scabra TaxID=79078 RepID=A0ABU6Z2C5_9FABA|nr:hypothetical protein [Stylosanthes scabra]